MKEPMPERQSDRAFGIAPVPCRIRRYKTKDAKNPAEPQASFLELGLPHTETDARAPGHRAVLVRPFRFRD